MNLNTLFATSLTSNLYYKILLAFHFPTSKTHSCFCLPFFFAKIIYELLKMSDENFYFAVALLLMSKEMRRKQFTENCSQHWLKKVIENNRGSWKNLVEVDLLEVKELLFGETQFWPFGYGRKWRCSISIYFNAAWGVFQAPLCLPLVNSFMTLEHSSFSIV